MVNCIQINGCCSILELLNLNNASKTSIKNTIRAELHFKYYDKEFPHIFIAATTKNQKSAQKALKALGFASKQVLGRHAKNDKDTYLTMWYKESFDLWWKK